jgi:hypothetical protein
LPPDSCVLNFFMASRKFTVPIIDTWIPILLVKLGRKKRVSQHVFQY